MTVVGLDDLLDNRKAQPGAFLFACVERRKDFLPLIRRNSATVIDDELGRASVETNGG